MPLPHNYDKRPIIKVNAPSPRVGWNEVRNTLSEYRIVIIDCYVGVRIDDIVTNLRRPTTIDFSAWMWSPKIINRKILPWLGGDDPIFGALTTLQMTDLVDPARLTTARRLVKEAVGPVLVVGPGASMVAAGDALVYADMPRWEGQLRQRRGEVSNLGVENRSLDASLQYKRSFFVDWRVCDRWKKPLLKRADAFLDTTTGPPKLVSGSAMREGLAAAIEQPFRVVPFFDPGPWGGQWMRDVCDLRGYSEPEPPNYAWCFDCVPEENSVLLRMGDTDVEVPSVNIVYQHPRELLGDAVHARFGDEFPIRFDFLDTMGGGNLSLQVHPLTEYIQQHFGMHYTQDESYYFLDASDVGTCYLGVKADAKPQEMRSALELAQEGGKPFEAARFTNVISVKKHDHMLIPAGTVHCSGANTMVLEISATPYIFTFKLWDWGRLGLDGKPRPINIERGMANIDFSRDEHFCWRELINQIEKVDEGPGWREERTGLHRRQFIETRRHWFTQPVRHSTGGTEAGGVNVLNLVEGDAATVVSPTGAFKPFEVHYAETFIVPAHVGSYVVQPTSSKEHATVKAYVRSL